MTSDGTKTAHALGKNEDFEPALKQLIRMATMPSWIKNLSEFALKMLGWTRMHSVVSNSGEKTVDGLWKLQYERKLYPQMFEWY